MFHHFKNFWKKINQHALTMCTCSPGVKGGKGINHLPPFSWLFCLYERWRKRSPGKYIQFVARGKSEPFQETLTENKYLNFLKPQPWYPNKWTDCMIAFKSKQLWTETVESWWFQNGMQMKKKVPTLWSGEIDINPPNHHPKVTSPITSPPYLLPLLPSVFIIPLHCPPRGLPATGGRALLKSSMKQIEKG